MASVRLVAHGANITRTRMTLGLRGFHDNGHDGGLSSQWPPPPPPPPPWGDLGVGVEPGWMSGPRSNAYYPYNAHHRNDTIFWKGWFECVITNPSTFYLRGGWTPLGWLNYVISRDRHQVADFGIDRRSFLPIFSKNATISFKKICNFGRSPKFPRLNISWGAVGPPKI